MKRALIGLSILSLLVLSLAAAPSSPAVRDAQDTARNEGARGGQLQQGGTELSQDYGQGGRELGKGARGFGSNVAHGDFGAAGSELGRGSAAFGKNVGTGTARGFKHFGIALRNLGRKIDRSVSDKQ